MNLFNSTVTVFSQLARDDCFQGMLLQAARDIFLSKQDRDSGYKEYKFANEGDDLEIVGLEEGNEQGDIRVRNKQNFDQVEAVKFTDLEDTFNDYKK